MRIDKESFDKICREYPDIKQSCLDEANYRLNIETAAAQTIGDLRQNAKKVIRKYKLVN